LVCFGVDPCGTAKNTVEGSGVVEHCKESTNDIVVKKDMVLVLEDAVIFFQVLCSKK